MFLVACGKVIKEHSHSCCLAILWKIQNMLISFLHLYLCPKSESISLVVPFSPFAPTFYFKTVKYCDRISIYQYLHTHT